jgi:prepilin-type processing-associated H-X9-DG protein
VCLSNIKNIALAVQMYMGDNNDTLWPAEHRSEVIDGFVSIYAKELPLNTCGTAAPSRMNPYLMPIVILDEYVKNRDVWRCPSARSEQSGFPILNAYGGDWWKVILSLGDKDTINSYGFGQCTGGNWPPGWGGQCTDTVVQENMRASGPGAFASSINITGKRDLKAVMMDDPVRYVVVGEGSQPITDPVSMAYPDAYAMCGANPGAIACCDGNWVDWEDPDCAFSVDCGAAHDLNYSDPQIRKEYGKARHLGGVNVGFGDGHASWFNSELILDQYAPDDPNRQWISGMSAAQWAERQKRDTWDGFVNGICHFEGGLGAGPWE